MFRFTAKPSETLLEQEDTEFNLPEEDTPTVQPEPEAPSRFFDQLIVAAICLILLLLGMKSGHSKFQWVRERLHAAMEASTEATFGVLGHSPVLQGLIRTSQNFIKLEEITQPLWQEKNSGIAATTSPAPNVPLPGAVWPVNGNVTRSFGWQYNSLKHTREFNSEIEITALPGAPVHALNGGEVVAIARQSGEGWQVTIDHGGGWVSVYRNLGEVKALIGQKVTSGSLLGSLNPSATGNSKLGFQVKYETQPVDPLTLFAA